MTTADVPLSSGSTRVGENPKSASSRDDGPMTLHDDLTEWLIDPILETLQMTSGTNVATTSCSVPDVVMTTPMSEDDPRWLVSSGDPNATDGLSFVIPLNDEDPELPSGNAFASSSSCSCGSRVSSDEDTHEEGLRRKCGISEEIMLVAPRPANRADARPSGYMTLFENYFDQCLLWFSLPRFLMRFLAVHGIRCAQINPRGIRHLLGIYMLSRGCGVAINTEYLSYLTDFRVHGESEELKHTVTNSSGMTLIAGFPSKDDHFEDRFYFVEIYERTVEADCIDLVKTRWERRVKPSFPEAALEAAAKAKGSSGTSTPRVVAPMSSTPTALSVRARSSKPLASKTLLPPLSSSEVAEFRRLSAERALISSGKGKGVDRETPSKRQRVDTYPAAVLSLFFDRLVGDYDEDVRSRDSEINAANEANAALQSKLDKLAERNVVLERDALSVEKVNKDYEDKLTNLKSKCTKAEGEVVQLRGELSSASDLQRSRIDDAVAEARDEMARGSPERASKVAGLLADIGGKAQNDMLNLTEIDANLEFIDLLQGLDPPDLPTEVKALRGRRHPIYDAHDVFADLLASVRRVLEILVVSAGAAEASVAVDDVVKVSDEDDVEVTDNDED
ncbi:hypothetical protein AALP_AAs43988U000100 [Arabis alpina]|uniref:Uncharacterized protein n=1 Tax=Arabis alpina TaxID=50452 RepID=A0A087FZN3_ARAAL|nr:hypothetical protein AALP_AAs43988U000100 [Arabis alpina]